MSEVGSSPDLSEFFNDDDSEGLRFVDFIKQRRSARKRKFLFMDCETDRMSFEVQLEKLPTHQLKKGENGDTNKKAGHMQSPSDIAAIENCDFINSQTLPLRTAHTTKYDGGLKTRPIRSARSNRPAIYKNVGAFSPSDRFTRVGKNYTSKKLALGRRALLQEFESTVENTNFNPPVCSTQISQLTLNVSRSPSITKNLPQTEDIEPNIAVQASSTDNANTTRLNVLISSDSRQNFCSLSQRGLSKVSNSHSKKQGQEKEFQEIQNENFEIPRLSCNTLPRICSIQNVEIPKTQAPVNLTDNTLPIGSVREQHINVIPVNQTSSKISGFEKDNIDINGPQIEICSSTVKKIQEAEDNLKLTDILTDDEDNTPKFKLQNAKPLNLAPSSYSLCKKHLRKRNSSKLKLHNVNSQQLVSEAQGEMAPPLESNRQIVEIYEPLNSPPGVPLNGEIYAQELARMSNYEILDLRKRNSVGQIFVTSGSRSRSSLEDINKKKHQLNSQIADELLKRNLDNITQQTTSQLDQENTQYGGSLPVPYNFRDSLTAQKRDQNILNDSCFIDEKSSDRVKFKCNKKKGRLLKKKTVPEILKQYLKVSKRYSKRKLGKWSNNITKRSLFNKESLNESYESDSLRQNSNSADRTSRSRLKELSIPYLKSPPPAITSTIEMQYTPVKTHRQTVAISTTTRKIYNIPEKAHADVVSCSTTTEDIQNTSKKMQSDLDENLTPPPGFESDANQYTANATLKARAINDHFNANNDDNLFMKPINPPSKKRNHKKGKIVKESAVGNQGSTYESDTSDLTAVSSFRRSKRGQVPLCLPPILAVFRQQEIKRQELSERAREIRRKKQQQEETNIQKLNKTKTKYTKSTRIKTKHTTIKINVAESQKENMLSKKNNQSNRLEFDPQPPIEYIDNTYPLSTNTTINPIPPQRKVNPFKIRIRRLKPSGAASTAGSTTVTSTTVSSTSTFGGTNSNNDLVSRLKNMGTTCNSDLQTFEVFKDARISCFTNLRFIEFQGLDYAFYNTGENAYMGYLRFKPRQHKPKKKAKHFELNFINILGLFRITVNHKKKVLAVGDMEVIKKLTCYDIENLSDDVGILMVIKN